MKGVYIPFKSLTANILIEKFKKDAFFSADKIENEEEYLNYFLIYRRKLGSLAALVAEKAKKLYNKKITDLNFVASSLHAFYTKNKNVKIFDIEKHIDVFAWFFVHKKKLNELLGIDINLKNIESIDKLYELQQLANEDTKFSDLWLDIITYLLNQDAQRKQKIIYPENKSLDNLKEADIILVEIEGKTEEDFNNFRKLITLTNKNKSSKLCIFNNYDSFVNYLNSYYLFLMIFNPKLGFFLTSEKKGLVAHVIAISKQNKETREIADYMNDHNVSFLANTEKMREIEQVLAKRLFEDEQERKNYLEGVDKTIDFINSNFSNIVQENISDVFNLVSHFIENNLHTNPLDKLTPGKTEQIIRKALTRFFTDKVLSDFIKNKTKNNLSAELIDFVKNIKKNVDAEKYQAIAKKYISLINSKIAKDLTNILESSFLESKITGKENSIFNFKTILKIPDSNDVFDFHLKINLNDIIPDPSFTIIKIDYPTFVREFLKTNRLEFSSQKLEKIAQALIKRVDKESFDLVNISIYTRAGLLNLFYEIYSLMLYHKTKEKAKAIIESLKSNEQELKNIIEDVFYVLLIDLLENQASENIKTMFRNIASALITKFENPSIINDIDKKLDTLKFIKDTIEGKNILRKNLTSFYMLKTNNTERFKFIEGSLVFLKNSINLLLSIKNKINMFLNQKSNESFFSFEEFYKLITQAFENLDLGFSEEIMINETLDDMINILNKEVGVDENSIKEIVREYITKEITHQVFSLLYESIYKL